jgi:uncharacterized protein (DUF433 family)
MSTTTDYDIWNAMITNGWTVEEAAAEFGITAEQARRAVGRYVLSGRASIGCQP